jgi:hypothetical protein
MPTMSQLLNDTPSPVAPAPGAAGKKRARPNQPEIKRVQPVAGALPTSVPNWMSTPLMALLNLSKSRIRQLITVEGMPTDPAKAKLWYEANAKKNPSYKRGPAKHQEMLLAGTRVEGGSFVVAASSSSVHTGILQHALGISAARVGQLKILGMPTDSLDDAVAWRRDRITPTNKIAGECTKINPVPVLFVNELRSKFDQRNVVILVVSNWRVTIHDRMLRLLAKDAKFAMMAAVSGSLHLVITHTEKLHIILWAMHCGFYSDAMHALNVLGPDDSELWPMLALVCALRINDLMVRDFLISRRPIFKAIAFAAANDDNWREHACSFDASARCLFNYSEISRALELHFLARYLYERALQQGLHRFVEAQVDEWRPEYNQWQQLEQVTVCARC